MRKPKHIYTVNQPMLIKGAVMDNPHIKCVLPCFHNKKETEKFAKGFGVGIICSGLEYKEKGGYNCL